MESIMVSCKRFRGQHCAENIRQEYKKAVSCYNIADKITNIVTDSATNMAKAFQVTLPGFTCDKDTSLKEDTHESDSEDDDEDSSLEPIEYISKHGRCFAHTLQLVVKGSKLSQICQEIYKSQ